MPPQKANNSCFTTQAVPLCQVPQFWPLKHDQKQRVAFPSLSSSLFLLYKLHLIDFSAFGELIRNGDIFFFTREQTKVQSKACCSWPSPQPLLATDNLSPWELWEKPYSLQFISSPAALPDRQKQKDNHRSWSSKKSTMKPNLSS